MDSRWRIESLAAGGSLRTYREGGGAFMATEDGMTTVRDGSLTDHGALKRPSRWRKVSSSQALSTATGSGAGANEFIQLSLIPTKLKLLLARETPEKITGSTPVGVSALFESATSSPGKSLWINVKKCILSGKLIFGSRGKRKGNSDACHPYANRSLIKMSTND